MSHRRYYFSFLTLAFLASPVGASYNYDNRLAQLQEQLNQQAEQIRSLQQEVWDLKNQSRANSPHEQAEKVSDPGAQQPKYHPQLGLGSAHKPAPMPLAGGSNKPVQAPGSKGLYDAAMELLKEQRSVEAEKVLNQFIKNYPNDPLVVNAYYWRAETYYIRGDYPQAALMFGEAYEAYLRQKKTSSGQASEKGPEIMLKLASSLASIGKYGDAKVILQEMDKEFKSIPSNILQQADLLRREISRNMT